MLRVHQIVLSLDDMPTLDEPKLISLCAQRLKLPAKSIANAVVVKRSVDARDKGDVHFTLTADVTLQAAHTADEPTIAARFKPNQVAIVPKAANEARDVCSLPLAPWRGKSAPVVVGAGPAGLFCALALAVRGAKPILLERGKPVEARAADVEDMEQHSHLNPESNVLFGEGGAGAFSDGKLTCGLSSPHIRTVLETLCACGAPKDILLSQRPHIGTDELRRVLVNVRKRLTELGADIRFETRMTDVVLHGGRVAAVCTLSPHGEDEIATDVLCLAIGHSARDTYEQLYKLGLPMQPKPFAVGVRIEHLRSDIDHAQYGACAGHPALPPAEYKLNAKTPDGRGVYTFCMCPGGQVIAAISEAGGINVNGMSYHARDGVNSNAAVLVGVTPADFGTDDPLAGVLFQRQMEQAAYSATGSYKAPCQRVGDFLSGRETTAFGAVQPTYRPGVMAGDIRCCLPSFITQNLKLALPVLSRRLRGFDAPDALLTAPETRSSAPLRMLRDQARQSPIGGLYPLGEGAGYAGGIVSAAVDGLLAGMDIQKEE